MAKDLYQQNGQLTYNDLVILSRGMGIQNVKEIIKLMAILLLYALVLYAALFLLILTTMAASLPNFQQKPQMQLDLYHQSILQHEMVKIIGSNTNPSSPIGNGGSECLFGNWSLSILQPAASSTWIYAIEEQRNFSIY